MIRLLLLLAIIVVAVLVARHLLKRATNPRAEAAPQDAAEASVADAKLVRCVECGAFVPKASALPVPAGFRCGGAGCAPR